MILAQTNRSAARVCAAACVFATAGLATAGTTTYILSDHPDSVAEPPPYGLRLDGLFGGMSGADGRVTSFSFSHPMADMRLTVSESSPSDVTIRISGMAYGGEDTNDGLPGQMDYGFGEGLYEIDFAYNFNVSEVEDGFIVTPSDTGNEGSIMSLGNSDVAAGTSFMFYEQAPSENSFAFRRDGFRLTDAERGLLNNPFIGRAWMTFNSDGSDAAGLQDWLFMGQIIPTPLGAGMGVVGGAILVGARRRRNGLN